MSKGAYNGGSTIIRPGSDWFSESFAKPDDYEPLTSAALVRSAEASADRAEKRRAKIAALNDSPDAGKLAAKARLKRRKLAKKSSC